MDEKTKTETGETDPVYPGAHGELDHHSADAICRRADRAGAGKGCAGNRL